VNRKAIFVALLVSLGVSLVLWKQLQAPKPVDTSTPVAAPAPVETRPVVVAKNRIPTRTRLEAAVIAESFEIRDIATSSMIEGALNATDSMLNKYTSMTVLPGDQMTSARMLEKDAVPNLSFAVKQGRRAFTIPVDPVKGIAGFIQQGDFVDIIATFRPPGAETVSKMILQDIQILAVGKTYFQELDLGAGASPTAAIMSQMTDLITLSVTPEELERLMYLDSAGVFYKLVLKNPLDKDIKIVTKGATEKIVMKDLGIDKDSLEGLVGIPKPVVSDIPAQPVSPIVPTFTPAPIPDVPEDLGTIEVIYGPSRRKEDVLKEGRAMLNAPNSASSGSTAQPSVVAEENGTSE
jgi:pilus assembly protein CpaB